jgi:hypothetical protein
MNVSPVKGMVFSSLWTLSKRRPKLTRRETKEMARFLEKCQNSDAANGGSLGFGKQNPFGPTFFGISNEL